jgi:uncharacterized protein (TIGR03086 family)
MTVPYDLAPAAVEIGRLADGVTERQFADPTPCSDWPVAVLLDHLIGLTDAFTDGARKKPRPDAPEPTADLPAGWRDLLQARLDGLVEAWRDPAAWSGEATVGGVTMPADLTAAVAADELVVHGWDLARGTGQPYRPDPVLVQAALGFAERFADLDDGPFGPSVAVPADAPPFDRLLGAAGRDQGWTPATASAR